MTPAIRNAARRVLSLMRHIDRTTQRIANGDISIGTLSLYRQQLIEFDAAIKIFGEAVNQAKVQ